ncbi:MAG: hypothetical protein QOH76_223 [Thermoleophilaceae bacterium]|nr:hypothetical protein [Thermoleophilaceae bacterium]
MARAFALARARSRALARILALCLALARSLCFARFFAARFAALLEPPLLGPASLVFVLQLSAPTVAPASVNASAITSSLVAMIASHGEFMRPEHL